MTPLTSAVVAEIRRLVEVESPSSDVAGLHRCADELHSLAKQHDLAVFREDVAQRPTLLVGARHPAVLLLGHLDTVHPLGSITERPCRVNGDRLAGPGALDMKAGLVMGLHALQGSVRSAMLVTSDEELGTPDSRDLILEYATRASAVLVLEPSAAGALKTERKGVYRYEMRFAGRAAHAGLDPHSGANALVAMAVAVTAAARLGRSDCGTTVTPTIAVAGSASNVVPDTARLTIDARAWTAAEAGRVESALSALCADTAIDGVQGTLVYGPARPPMEGARSARLFELVCEVAAALGIEVPASEAVGGGSDGSLTAAAGIDTLDGLGAVGAGAHTLDEWVDLPSLVPRIELLRGLIARIAADPGSGR